MPTGILLPNFPPTGWQFFLNVSDEVSGDRKGLTRVKQLGPDLWAARYEANQLLPDGKTRRMKALVQSILIQRNTFRAWDPVGQYPTDDPGGIKLTSPGNVRINSINADAQRLTLKGLPPGYVMTRGDYLSFTYGSAQALHQIWEPSDVAANGAGVTPEMWVVPRIRPGAGVNAQVLLEKPWCEMMIVPGSYTATEGPRFGSIAFSAIQVLP